MSNKPERFDQPAEKTTSRAGESQKLNNQNKNLPAGFRNQSGQSTK